MKNKKLIAAIAITAALTIPVSVFAAASDTSAAKKVRGFFGIDTTQLTDTQKADVTSYKQKLAELQKEFINKMVANGSITREEGDAQIAKIDEDLKNGDSMSIPGFGGGKGIFGGRGMKNSPGLYGMDVSKLTDTQKADLTGEIRKIADLQKDLVTKAVSAGLLTQEKGTAATAEIDTALADIEKNGFTNGTRLLEGFGYNGILKGMDKSKLTDAQKSIFTDYNTNLTALQKELVNKMVSDGALTQEQGTSVLARIDQMSGFQTGNGGNRMQGGMGKGHAQGRGKMNGGRTQQGTPFDKGSGTTTGSSVEQGS